MSKICHGIHRGGSGGFSASVVKRILTCPRKHYLIEQLEEAGIKRADTGGGALVGEVGHAFLGLYYETQNRGFDTNDVQFVEEDGTVWDPPAKERGIADKVFRAYRAKYPPEELGKIVGVEVPVAGEVAGYAMTGRLDLVIKPTAAQVKAIKKSRNVQLTSGLYYIVDHKFLANANPIAVQGYVEDFQFALYQELFRQTFPKRELGGLLGNFLFKTEKTQFAMYLAPPLDRQRAAFIESTVQVAARLTSSIWNSPAELPMANPTACFDWGKVCSFKQSGRCPGY